MGSKIKITKKQEEQIIQMRRNGMGFHEIGNAIGVSQTFIWGYLKSKNLDVRLGGLRENAKPKDSDVCKGCRYKVPVGSGGLKGCDYIGIEGHSRLLEEERNGGFRTDACCCYKRGKGVRNTSKICVSQKRKGVQSKKSAKVSGQ